MTRSRRSASRDVINELLAELRAGRWRPRAWARFLGQAVVHSWNAARERPRAAAEVTVLHGALAALGRGRGHAPGERWVAVSWALSMTHLGMLESRHSLGLAIALLSDLVDGHLARRLGTATPFGRDSDSIADAAFWTWFAVRHEPDRRLRLLALGGSALPVATVTAISAARGRMVDVPRPVAARPAAALQIVLTARALISCSSAARNRRRRLGGAM